jgi:heat shock protein HslJ
MKKIIGLFLGVLLLTVIISGCTSQPAATTTPVTTKSAVQTGISVQPVATEPPVTFPTGTSWRLSLYEKGNGNMTMFQGDDPVTAVFDKGGNITGFSGCNQYLATYLVTGTNMSITPPASTRMACPAPVMQQESRYLELLTNVASWSNSPADTLTLYDRSGSAVLVYKHPVDVSVGQPGTSPLVGSWDLLTYNNGKAALQSVSLSSVITAEFTKDGKLAGSAGCNAYTAGYFVNVSKISISQPASTKKACEPDLMQQENQYLTLLSNASSFETTGDKLTIFDAAGTKLLEYKSHITSTAPVPPVPAGIIGSWDLVSYDDGSGGSTAVITAAPVTAIFGANGKLSGSSGCNQYSTTYTTSGSGIVIPTQFATTLMYCSEPVNKQESTYLSLLPRVSRYLVSGDLLTLSDSAGTKLLIYKSARGTAPGT